MPALGSISKQLLRTPAMAPAFALPKIPRTQTPSSYVPQHIFGSGHKDAKVCTAPSPGHAPHHSHEAIKAPQSLCAQRLDLALEPDLALTTEFI